jgi:PncC family amidohydrolase
MNRAKLLAATLTDHGLTLATAESCTGGGLSTLLTSIPGSSAFFVGGVIAYRNDVKTGWLGVPQATLDAYGAVSRQVALAMAEECRRRFNTDMAISITGIAGPGGGSLEKPVGLVFLGVAGTHRTAVVENRFDGDRAHVRAAAVSAAIELALDLIANWTTAPS